MAIDVKARSPKEEIIPLRIVRFSGQALTAGVETHTIEGVKVNGERTTWTIEAGKVGADGSQVDCGNFHDPPQKEAGQIIEDEDTNETVEQIIAWLDERKLI